MTVLVLFIRQEDCEKRPVEAEAPTIAFAFASVVAIKDLNPGDVLSEENIWVKRPGGGDYGVKDYDSLIGRKARVAIKSGYQLKHDHIVK